MRRGGRKNYGRGETVVLVWGFSGSEEKNIGNIKKNIGKCRKTPNSSPYQ
jgi:hypothetical protein